MREHDFETRLTNLLRERGEYSVEQFDPQTVADAAIEGAQQRGPGIGLRRIFHMLNQISRPARYGLAAAIVALVAMGGGLLYVGGIPWLTTATPSATATATATPSPPTTVQPTPTQTPSGPILLLGIPYRLAGGTYLLEEPYPAEITFDVPGKWTAVPVAADGLGVGPEQPDSGWGITFALVGEVLADPCLPDGATLDASVAESAEAMAAAIASWPGFTSSAEQMTVGGYPATQIELTRTYDPATCANPVLFRTPLAGRIEPRPGGVSHLFQLIVLDIDGTPLVIRTTDYPESTEHADSMVAGGYPYPASATHWMTAQTELRTILESITITPR